MSIVGVQAKAEAAQGADGAHALTASCAYRDRPEADHFLEENDAAMQRMMAGMTAPPSGDIDQDFATTMIAHHQGAIDMAWSYLRSGRNQTLLRLAQEIIITQQQEITVMQRAVDATAVSKTGLSPHCAQH